MLIRDLKVVLFRNLRGVAEPLADDVIGEGVFQFGLAGGSKIVEQLRPRFQPGAILDDAFKVGAQVGVGAAVAGNHEIGGQRGGPVGVVRFGVSFEQQRLKLGEQRYQALVLSFVVLGFGRVNHHRLFVKVDVSPRQFQVFGRTAQATISGQGKQHLPFGVGASADYLAGNLAGNKEFPIAVFPDAGFHLRERIAGNYLAIYRHAKELLCTPTDAPRAVLRHPLRWRRRLCGRAAANARSYRRPPS